MIVPVVHCEVNHNQAVVIDHNDDEGGSGTFRGNSDNAGSTGGFQM